MAGPKWVLFVSFLSVNMMWPASLRLLPPYPPPPNTVMSYLPWWTPSLWDNETKMSSFSLVFARIFHHNTGNDANIDRIRRETWVLSLVLVGISLLTGRALAPLSRTCDMFTTHPDFPQPTCWPGVLPSVPDQREDIDLDSQVCCITFCKNEIVLGSLNGKMWMIDRTLEIT